MSGRFLASLFFLHHLKTQNTHCSVKLTIPFDAPYYFVSTSFHVPHLLDPLSALPGRDEVILESFVQTSRFDKKVGGWGGDVERVEVRV